MRDSISRDDLKIALDLALEQLRHLSYDSLQTKLVQDACKSAHNALGEVARTAEIARQAANLERYEREAQKTRDKIAELESSAAGDAS